MLGYAAVAYTNVGGLHCDCWVVLVDMENSLIPFISQKSSPPEKPEASGAEEVNKTEETSDANGKQHDDIQRTPTFCSEDVLTQILDSLLDTTSIKSINKTPSTPIQAFTPPFLNWSTDKVYSFFLSDVQPLGGELSGAWPAHTSLIFDARTIEDRTYLLCSDTSDFMDADRVVLKTIRSELDQAWEEALVYGTFTRTPSESGDG
ncbi:hypothetical protein MMC32_001180 [Xylographa parallela]|nr:hypothetical protein [Xylographa parallela]